MNRVHKRFTGFAIAVGALVVGFLAGPVDAFAAFAAAVGLAYGAYVGGQSATDFKNGAVK